MNIFKDIDYIAEQNEERSFYEYRLSNELDLDGLRLVDAYYVNNCEERDGHLYSNGKRLDNKGLVDDDYYCKQHRGDTEDYYYGTLYFKTNRNGVFVAVPFDM